MYVCIFNSRSNKYYSFETNNFVRTEQVFKFVIISLAMMLRCIAVKFKYEYRFTVSLDSSSLVYLK